MNGSEMKKGKKTIKLEFICGVPLPLFFFELFSLIRISGFGSNMSCHQAGDIFLFLPPCSMDFSGSCKGW